MLLLTRKAGEFITIGDDIKISIIQTGRRKTLVGITAPRNLSIKRIEGIKNIIKVADGQTESDRDVTFSKEGIL